MTFNLIKRSVYNFQTVVEVGFRKTRKKEKGKILFVIYNFTDLRNHKSSKNFLK